MLTIEDANRYKPIEAWAEQCVKEHRKECRAKSACGGRSKIWWTTRHPDTPDSIRVETVVSYVRERTQACEALEARLLSGQYPWIEGERESYRRRTAEERAVLLGREIFPPDTGTPEVRKSVSEMSPMEQFRRMPLKKAPDPLKEPEEYIDWVDSLMRRRD